MVKGTGPKLVKLEEITLDPDLRQGLAKVFGMKITHLYVVQMVVPTCHLKTGLKM